MKPDFALSLSFDGITFLGRLQDGWHQFGKVPLEHIELDDALADLRRAGEDFAGGDALCKIILPNDQIRYLTIEKTEIDVDTAARTALEGATPYAIDELAFDIVEDGDQIQIAAVARETLAEAEDFATEHGFHPVAFVGVPDKATFAGEPFFGPTAMAANLIDDPEALGPDEAAIVVTSEGDLPEKLEEPPQPAPSFATSRSLEDQTAPALPGAARAADAGAAPKISGVTDENIPDAPAPSGAQISQQESRIDPAALIAGLKARPSASNGTRPRGAARNKPEETAAAATAAADQPIETKAKGFGVTPTEVEVGGKPKYLGLILIVVLLVFMAGVAVWASLFGGEGTAGLFSPREDVEQIAILPDPAVQTETITDSAEIEALDDNEGILIDPVLEAAEPALSGEAFYAATGIWDRAPAQPNTPSSETAEGIYVGSFETTQDTHDAIALPTAASFGQDAVIAGQNNPVAAGIQIDLDDRGLVIAAAEGAISPEGIMVYLGKPPVLPEAYPARSFAQTDEETPVEVAAVSPLAQYRPQPRPFDLSEQNQRANLGGSTLSELAKYRPRLRPEELVQVVSIDPAAIAEATNEAVQEAVLDLSDATDQAVVASLKPQTRPSNFARTVARQQEQQASVAVPRAERVTPSIPTTASVARNATQQNAISLRKINLIGVYGANNNRRALVRLSTGRYRKVKVGDRIDGGRVAAISTSELRYVKNNRSVVLKMPQG